MLKQPNLFTEGYSLQEISLDPSLLGFIQQEKWDEVDQYFKEITSKNNALFKFLQQFHSFTSIQTMISIRDASNDWEEDGIWHDDGSRVFAFSLSITPNAREVEGVLELRRKNSDELIQIPTPDYGTAILFLTGIHGYEHRTRAVKKGRRIILVGWCS